jgi:hypothetical protein
MTKFSRFAWRLRRRALRGYEIALYGLLVAMALATALPAASFETEEAPAQCGNIQSSPTVMTR